MRLTPRMLRRLSAALMLSSSLTVASMALTAQAQSAQDPVSVFLTSQFTYCDAKLIAGLWNINIDQAKAEIGEKIINGLSENIPFFLTEARKRPLRCEWADTPHNYDDAERLAQLWAYDSVEEAKAKIAYLYTEGDSAQVLAALNGGVTSPSQPLDEEGLSAFFSSQFTYCDAKLIGVLWKIGIDEAKAEIGRKVINGYQENIPDFLVEARKRASCDFYETNVGYADAERLAGVWGVSTEQAKLKIARYYTDGQSAVVQAALGR